ncbi:2-dehydropantoate 2-reductase [Metabacillus fastidiosus]|uniref:2-dehydropantoate 2-reductase n=1 Tax=Metabacillus fastidiosus TaxID=1458 RepID=UPI002DBE8958|nr:2-dehydropantoate 2-reductase [Metabacillus fastidiosus]MEC2074707.1 2-dehydropantoate 2-reductase [Metabacillus fastidiosus]
MQIGIIGSGAIGLLFAHYLGKHHEINVYTRRESGAQLLNERGIELIFNTESLTTSLKATAKPTYEEEILFIAVKQYQLKPIVQKLKEMPKKRIIFLQNGIGHLEFFPELSKHELFVGVVEHGALKIDERTVCHTGVGVTKLAAVHGESYVHKVFENEDEYFLFKIENDFQELLMEKLIVNAAINPLTALLRCKNGQLFKNKDYQLLMEQIFKEVYCLFPFKKEETSLWNYVNSICKKTAENESSMLKDIKEGRPTEIDAIIGSLLEKAEKMKKAVPYLTFVYYAVKGLEQGN